MAKEFEPALPLNTNPMMVHDFGVYDMKSFRLPRRFESPGVLPSLGDILETAKHKRCQTVIVFCVTGYPST